MHFTTYLIYMRVLYSLCHRCSHIFYAETLEIWAKAIYKKIIYKLNILCVDVSNLEMHRITLHDMFSPLKIRIYFCFVKLVYYFLLLLIIHIHVYSD